MAKPQPWRVLMKRAAAFTLDEEHRRFTATNNGVFAWEAYRVARAARVPVPGWVLSYLDRCARGLCGATGTREVADALGLATRGGPPPSKKTQARYRDDALVDETRTRHSSALFRERLRKAARAGDADAQAIIRACGTAAEKNRIRTVGDAVAATAEAHGLAEETIRDLLYSSRRRPK